MSVKGVHMVLRSALALGAIVFLGLALSQAMHTYPVPGGSRPHDVAPATDGGVWYTGQNAGELGWLNPATGEIRRIHLGQRARPHGVIVGPDGAPWITDGGLNAIVRFDPVTETFTSYPHSSPQASVRQILGRPGEIWGAESGTNRLVVLRTR